MTFICLGGHWDSDANLGRLEYQTARTVQPCWCQQRFANADQGVPDHLHSCDSFVEALGGLKPPTTFRLTAERSKHVFV